MKVLIIAQRNLGDAVMLNYFIQNSDINEELQITILTKSTYKDIFSQNNKIKKVIIDNLPMITCKSYNIIKHIKTIFKLRQEHFDIVLDYVGDFRERIIACLCGGKELVSVRRGNGFNNLVKDYCSFLVDRLIIVSDSYKSTYDQIEYILNSCKIKCALIRNFDKRHPIVNIGIHPFASQECKMWDWEKWYILVSLLLDEGYSISLFGAQNQRNVLLDKFKNLLCDRLLICTDPINEFFLKIKDIDLLIGLDSFSVHAAYCNGVDNIMLCGSNDYSLWHTPNGKVICKGRENCNHWPCYNLPKCNGEYTCIKAIDVFDVISMIKTY